MEFHETLQQLRKQKQLTQEELAAALYVSRTAVSKWESGRGYPSIDSLKMLAQFYGVTIDALLSGEELLCAAEEDRKQNHAQLRDAVFGLLDCSVLLFLFLPLFGVTADGTARALSLMSMGSSAPYLRLAYVVPVIALPLCGLLLLIPPIRDRICHLYRLSYLFGILSVLLFIVSPQPYAAAVLFLFVLIKTFLLFRRP